MPSLWWLLACAGPRPEVVVVGGGPAGMAAAIEASACAHVQLVEGRDQLGGSALYGDAVTALPSPAELAELDAAGHPNAARTRFVERVRPDVVDWLTGLGVGWRPVPVPDVGGTEILEPLGGGVAVVQALSRAVEAAAVTTTLSTRVDGLERSPALAVKAGQRRFPARAVVLATGGFAGDPERVRAALGLGADVPLLRGAAPFADGNGIALATGVGGVESTPGHAVLYAHGVPAPDDPQRALMLVDGAHVFPVAADGTWLPAAQTPRGASGDVLLALPGATAWAILDQKAIAHVPLWDGDRREAVPALPAIAANGVQAATLPELADALGIPVEKLEAGVVATNREASPAHPLLASSPRWAALPLRLTTAKSLSGVRIDLDGRLLDAAGAVIPGVYAAGELAGFAHPWEERHVDSTMVSGAVLTGRAAGKAVCADLAAGALP